MKSFLADRPRVPSPVAPLAAHEPVPFAPAPAQPAAFAALAARPAPTPSPSPSAPAPAARGAAHATTVECVREGDRITRLIVTCACGERTEIDCLYGA
jgi:hypothetical protein